MLIGAALAAAAAWTAPAGAARPRSLEDPLLVGVDLALMQSGLARALQRAFGRDTGIAARLEAAPAAQVLERLERGELDATLTNAAAAERRLIDEGLAHDRQRVAWGRFLVVGPALPGSRAAQPETDVIAVLQRLASEGGAGAGPRVLVRDDGSGVHLAEQALWRAAGVAPQGAWAVRADPALSPLRQARDSAAHVLIDAALFGGPTAQGLTVVADLDPRLRFEVHLMRAFRVHHPAAALFTRWVAGGRGRRVVSTVRGYRVGTA